MRVLLDCRMATWSGVGRYTLGLTRALAARGDLDIVCAIAAGDAPPAPGLEAIEATAAPLSLRGMRELSVLQSTAHADLTHCLHFPTPLPVRGPLIVTMHDLTPLTVDGVMPSRTKRAVYRWFNLRAARLAAALITPSAFTAADVERLLPAAAGKTHVTLEGADDFASGPRATLTGPLAQQAASPYILSMGSTRAHKDLPTLVRAFVALAPAHPELQLLLAGREVPGFLDRAGLPDALRTRVSFTGPVTDDELRTLYAGAAVFAFPSRYEGFGLPPLEAMALGAPVVSSSAASLPEVVGDAGLTFPPGDDVALAKAVEAVLVDSALRDRLVAAGRIRASEITWAAAAERTVAVYGSVLSA